MIVPVRLLWPFRNMSPFGIFTRSIKGLRNTNDPVRFADLIQDISFGKVFKTTRFNRFELSLQLLESSIDDFSELVVLDIGSSDGSAIYNFLTRTIPRYTYLTDINLSLTMSKYFGFYFFHSSDILQRVEIGPLVFFIDNRSLKIFRPFFYIFNKLYKRSKKIYDVDLVNPIYSTACFSYCFMHYDVLTPFNGLKADLVIISNILNKSYFADIEIKKAISNVFDACNKDSSYLLFVENRNLELSTLLKFDKGEASLVANVNGGVEIFDYLVDTFGIQALRDV